MTTKIEKCQSALYSEDMSTKALFSESRTKSADEESSVLPVGDTTAFDINTASSSFHLFSAPELLSIFKSEPDGDTVGFNFEEFENDSDKTEQTFSLYTQAHEVCLPLLDSSYEFKEKLGTGGFGVVYKVYDHNLQREVAIKTLLEEHNKTNSSRNVFLTESKITAFLEHPNIVPIHGLYKGEQNQLYLIMKLIEGQSLRQLVQNTIVEYKGLAFKEMKIRESRNLLTRLEIFLKICDAISYAHDKKILHRDLKPGNVMIGQFNEVYVTDWGLAEISDRRILPGRRNWCGTYQYVAPEIPGNRHYDSRSDIYSLGVILFNISYLKKAFDETNSTENNYRKQQGKTVSPRHLFHFRFRNDLNLIIKKAMDINPSMRYQTVQGLANDVRHYIRGEAIFNTIFAYPRRLYESICRIK